MKISNNYSLSFGMKFVKNDAFKEVENYSKKIKRNREFNTALKLLEKADAGNVLIEHGIDQNGKKYSQFTLKNITVENTPYFDEPYLDASLRCLLDLANFSGRYKTLTGTNCLRTRPHSC